MNRSSLCLVVALASLAVSAHADVVQPVSVQFKEQEPGLFLVQWQVPQRIPARAMPEPVLPETCSPKGERVFQEQPGSWLNRQVFRCPDGLAGQELQIRYPFVNTAGSTMVRIEFLSGDQSVHVLPPGEEIWLVPEIETGLSANLWRNIRRGVLDGARHFIGGWLHFALWLAIGLVGSSKTSLRLITAFSLGQIVAVVLTSVLGLGIPALLGECAVAIAVVLLADRALKPVGLRRDLAGALGLAGLLHGLALTNLLQEPTAFADAGLLYLLLAVAGMDATLLVLALGLAALQSRLAGSTGSRSLSKGLSYGLGAAAVAGALVLILIEPPLEADTRPGAANLPDLGGLDGSAGAPGSRRVAPQAPQSAMQSFLSIEAFEVRNEILVRLRDFAAELDLDPTANLEIAAQGQVKERLQALVLPLSTVAINGQSAKAIVDRVDFLIVESQGVLPRPEPVPEPIAEAFVGLTLVYLTPQTPQQVLLEWQVFSDVLPQLPVTVTDPESSTTALMTAEQPRAAWQNNLVDDPVPTVAAIAVEPKTLPIPLLALPLLILAIFLGVAAARGRSAARNIALTRIALALALVVSPLGELAVALPTSLGSVPTAGQARRILAGVLPNVYRAFEFREESDAYDRLAVSVTGDTLSEIYLEHRRALEMEERGGARARVEAVEVPEVRHVEPGPDGGFIADGNWIVGGTVTHFGHRHFRQNRYDARVTMVPQDNTWKIRSIEIFDEERIR